MDLVWSCSWLATSRVRLLDTVLLDADGNPARWLYTSSKSGEVAVKDQSQLSWAKIARRFCKFAQAGASSTHQKGGKAKQCCVLLRHDGERGALDADALKALASPPRVSRAPSLGECAFETPCGAWSLHRSETRARARARFMCCEGAQDAPVSERACVRGLL